MKLLSNRFNTLLTQYKDTYTKFVETINSANNSFTSIPNTALIGGSTISILQNSSIQNCTKKCSAKSLCSGATFNNTTKTCSLSGGTNHIIKSPNQTAIVKQALQYTYQLQNINNDLAKTNTQMMRLANSKIGDYTKTQQLNTQKSTILQNNYKTLEQERVQIDEMIREYETINSAYENGTINVTSNYYKYITYIIVSIVLILVLIRYSMPASQIGGSSDVKTLWHIYVILGIIIIVNVFLNK